MQANAVETKTIQSLLTQSRISTGNEHNSLNGVVSNLIEGPSRNILGSLSLITGVGVKNTAAIHSRARSNAISRF